MYVKIAVNIPTESSFTYSVPEFLQAESAIGKRALVPFGSRKLTGYIIGFLDEPDFKDIREISDILDIEPLFTPDDLTFYSWAASYYHYPLGKALHDILPTGIDSKSDRRFKATDISMGPPVSLTDIQKKILDLLSTSPKGMSLKQLQKHFLDVPIRRSLTNLVKKKLVTIEEIVKRPEIQKKTEKIISIAANVAAPKRLTPSQQFVISYLEQKGAASISELHTISKNPSLVVRQLINKGLVNISEKEVYRSSEKHPEMGVNSGVKLNEYQTAAWKALERSFTEQIFSPFLLHGVTGSGKTEVYFSAIEKVLNTGGGAIYLVPEIALTPQLVSRVQNRFGQEEVAVIHSDIDRGIRYDSWRRLQSGKIRLAVGARSALFAPLYNLKLIVVDEEHDSSYKQDVQMHYHARDLAVLRAKLNNAVVILGSATPDINTYYHAQQGKYSFLSLPFRVENRQLPEAQIVDMKVERDDAGKIPVLSGTLLSALQQTLCEGMQSLFFLNRRGYHTFLFCPDCGHVFSCPNCAVSLTLHADANTLRCHYCDYNVKAPSRCPKCSSNRIQFHGTGTERIEQEIIAHFPGIRIARMDRDTTSKKGAHSRILNSFNRGEIDLLIGTQMITKGHDFSKVALVGVISADTALNLPDFRSSERTFQLLTQVSGRGGRGQQKGRVIIQTLNPGHYTIQRAKNHDYNGFYEDEIRIRKSLGYPPFSRMINLKLSSLNEDIGRSEAEKIGERARLLCQAESYLSSLVEVIGPAQAPISKIKGRYRWQILFKSDNIQALHSFVLRLLSSFASSKLEIKIDVDPVNFM